MPASVATAGRAQRRYSAAPGTGTLTTGEPSAWATGTSYVVDPTAGGISLVTNAGNLYQCRTAHTSSGANEPTTTSDTTQWKYLGDAPAATNTTAGSQIIVIHAGRADPMSTPTDNDSGTFTSTLSKTYSAFTQWGIGLYRRSAASNTKTGYTVSATWAETSPSSGAGEEVTLLWLELAGVLTGAPHATANVERTSATANTVTGASYTLNARCLVVSVWGGSGNVISAGTSHTSTAPSGLSTIGAINATMALSSDGYIQLNVAAGIREPGTYTDVWGSTEGAILFTVAYPVASLDGAASVTLGTTTLSATGTALVQGSSSSTTGTVTSSAAGVAPIAGGSGSTLGAVAVSSAGAALIQGSSASTLGAASSDAAGAALVAGTSAPTLGDVTVSAEGSAPIAGVVDATLGTVTLSAAAGGPTAGTADITLGVVAGSAAGGVRVAGTADVALGAASASADGAVAVSGALAASLGAMTGTAAGVAPIVGAAAPTLGTVTSSASGAAAVDGSAAPSLGAVTLEAAGLVGDHVIGAADVALGAVMGSAAGAVAVVGSAAPSVGAVSGSAAGAVSVAGASSVTMGGLSASGSGAVAVRGAAAPALGAVVGGGAGLSDAEGHVAVGELAAGLGAVAVAATGVVLPAPELSRFAALVAQMDETILEILG